VVAELDALVSQFERDATAAKGPDARRMRSLAGVIKERAAKLR
jgi:hypothetical protein